MSTFETKTSDNFIFDETSDPRSHDSNDTPFLRKNVSYVVDQQGGNGSYNSGEVIIDSSQIASSGNFINWRDAYIALPYNVRWDCTFGSAPGAFSGGTGLVKYALALKNCSLVSSIKVEANGKTIITANDGLSNLINFKLASTMTSQSLLKEGAVIGYYPDTQGQVGDGGLDSYNAANDPLSTSLFGDDVWAANMGLVARQGNFLPTTNGNFMSSSNVKDEGGTDDLGTGGINNVTTAQTPSDIHFVAVIRLRDLSDYFDKHSLSRGVSYRFTIRFNQAVSTLTYSAGTSFSTMPTVSTSLSSGTAQPAMFCAGPSSMLNRLTWASSVTSVHTITSTIDVTNARFSGVRLYVPSYELEPTHQELLLSKNPIIKKSFMDYSVQSSSTFSGPGSNISLQVSTSCTNPRAIIIIPRWSQTSTGNGGQGFYSDVSPLSTVPGSTDFCLSLKNIQVKIGSSYALPDRLYYSFQTFMDHISTIFSNQGNQSFINGSGVISKKMFETNHRYYAFDISRYPLSMENLPQMVSVECVNNSLVAVELTCILLYGREAEFNLSQGSLTITA